jgi:hypothetical protein
MSISERKEAMIDYILNRMSKYDIKRGLGLEEDDVMGFKSYSDFVEFQRSYINDLKEDQLGVIEYLRNHIVPNSKIMDKEYMSTWETDGFCLDSSKNIVFFHER